LRKSGTSALLLLFCSCIASAAPGAEREKPVLLVLAAASLTNVLGEMSPLWEKQSGARIKLSFAASSVLARQIEAGGQADVFVSADQQWMDYLQTRGLLDESSRRDLVGNRLVLIAPADSEVDLTIARGFPLLQALQGGRLSTGDPDTVPVGRYARSALISLGVWDEVANRLVRADNVRSALMFVARGETPLGIVYATDALMDRKVRVVDTFPAGMHEPITYPAAAMRGARSQATAYLAYLAGDEAAPVWKRYGFLPLAK
jgi:molybdate transport system substrate-binding protein